MTKSQLLERASQAIGQRIPGHRLAYCLDAGHVSKPTTKVGNCLLYEQSHLDQFLSYLKRSADKKSEAAQA